MKILLTVMKFGGTSVKDSEAFLKVSDIIVSKQEDIIVVLSAMAGVTDNLNDALETLQELTHGKRHEAVDGWR